MPTSKASTNTITKIELDAIPPSFPSSAQFFIPAQKAAYIPAKINRNTPKLSLIEIDPLIPEDHEACSNQLDEEKMAEEKQGENVLNDYFACSQDQDVKKAG